MGEILASTLYKQLGGYDPIYDIVEALLEKMEKDGRLEKYFAGHGEDSKKRLLQLQVEKICQAAGHRCFYLGRDMKTVHKGMGISGSDWEVMINYLIPIMDSNQIQDPEQKDVLKLLNSIKGDIVEVP